MTPEGSDTTLQNKLLSSNDIAKIAPYSLILYLVRGFNKKHEVSIAVVLDKDENNPKFSRGTGKVYITEQDDWESYCLFLRNHPDESINKRCVSYDKRIFAYVKKKATSDPNWPGKTYFCSSGNLREFVVPIVERESNAFIGAILGGQMRPRESRKLAKKCLKNFIAEEENKSLRSIPFRRLYTEFLKVRQVTEEELEKIKSECETLARELAKPFELLTKTKKAEEKEKIQMGFDDMLEVYLAEMSDFNVFWHHMNMILSQLQYFLRFDWGMALNVIKYSPKNEMVSKIRNVVGRGIGARENLLNKEFVFQSNALHDITKPQKNPKFLTQHIGSIVSGQPECWWIPLTTITGSIFGAIILGSSPQHPKTKYNGQYIQQWMKFVVEIALKIGIRYGELEARQKEKQRAEQLRISFRREKNLVDTLENTLLGLTHNLKKPMSFAGGALSLLRDIRHGLSIDEVQRCLNLGITITQHGALLCRGISKIFAAEASSNFEYTSEEINVRQELKTLSEAMQRVSGRKDISFWYSAEAPIIRMDKDSFFFVFYTLIDNALKYAKPDTTIRLLYTEERNSGKYALKVTNEGPYLANPSCVFKKFGRGPHAYRSDEAGIGLGCWAAREHMQRQGGDITLELTEKNIYIFIVHVPE